MLKNLKYQQSMYAKIYGNIRVFKDQKVIIGTHIKRIENHDEVTNHFLTVFTSMQIRKFGPIKPKDLEIDT